MSYNVIRIAKKHAQSQKFFASKFRKINITSHDYIAVYNLRQEAVV